MRLKECVYYITVLDIIFITEPGFILPEFMLDPKGTYRTIYLGVL